MLYRIYCWCSARRDQEIYNGIVTAYTDAVAALNFRSIVRMPICTREGDTIASRSLRTPWYRGAHLLGHVEAVPIKSFSDQGARFYFAVQWVNRPKLDFRGYAGTISSGTVRVGDRVDVPPGGRRGAVARIVTADSDFCMRKL